MYLIGRSLFAGIQKLLLRDAQLRQKTVDQLFDEEFEAAVDISVLQLVLLFVVELDAVLVKEAHDGRLPPRTAQEVDDDVEKPIVFALGCHQRINKLKL